MLCKDVMFFDENMKPLAKPDFEKCTNEEFEEMWFNSYYIFIDGKKALKEINDVIKKKSNYIKIEFNSPGGWKWYGSGNKHWSRMQDLISDLTIENNKLQMAYLSYSRKVGE
jgi:hypothetical protein